MPRLCWYERHKTAVQQGSLVVFDPHRCHGWQIARQLQLHCLSRLNPFIPCVCVFTYLSSRLSSRQTWVAPVFLAVQSSACSCKSRTWTRQYTRIHGAFQGIHGSREPGCNKRRVNDTFHYFVCGAVVMINVGLAQARPNHCKGSKNFNLLHDILALSNFWFVSVLLWFLFFLLLRIYVLVA